MRGHLLDALAEIEVVGELGPVLLLALPHFGREHAFVPQPLAQGTDELGVLADALDEDVAGAVERGLGIRDAFVGRHELLRLSLRHQGRVLEEGISQRLEASFARNLRLGPPLRLVRRIQVFELDLGLGGVDRAGELGRQLALFLDALENSRAAILQLAQVAEPLFQLSELRVVEAAGLFLAVGR